MQTQMLEQPVVEISREFNASPDSVFRAFTTPQLLQRWWGVTPEHETHICEVDLKVGGSYRLGMRGPDGEAHVVGGEYREIVPGKRLVFSWRWEHSAEDYPITIVSIDLTPQGSGCLLTLVHNGFPDAEQAGMHQQGWTGCLERLPNAL